MKNAYLIVPDLHLDFYKSNRVNYFNEIVGSMSDILEISKKYKEKGYAASLMLLGDVFDGSMPNASDAMQAIEVFRYFCGSFKQVYSVVGNHEITFAKDNPFWFLASEIGDESLRAIRRYLQPQGLCDTIKIPATVEDGEVTFYFNHFGTTPKVPIARGIRIGLFHQNVGSNDICKMWGAFDDVTEASYVQGYNYCYFGHMHLAKGKFFLNEEHTCQGEWLGTIGRTKVDEVRFEDLEVNIPAVLVDDGKFLSVEDNEITLQDPGVCIDYSKLQASQQSKKIIEEHRQVLQSEYKGETLYDTLKGAFAGTPMDFLLEFLSSPWEQVLQSYKETLKNPGGSDDE